MAQIIVRNLEEDIKAVLKQRASRHGWSMEEEVRHILRRAVNEEHATPDRLGSRIAARFAGVGLAEPLPESQGQPVTPMSFGA